ncbi:ABC transporter ATP-binding protein [Sediminivirga luteola]|uniref:Spermidine/putrescine import ATP-binding protein PotA n=1 Tax=Sediminivirga luteola TaxID=1774748 RepID=A0A8J2TWU0_9MICO|nr:polyamine ABC transporter ATP-binding protein [Sediminivirga luteola]GGA09722.1 hypothetical protein GCM10011333_10570 [Sediminivirga luteola]
MTTPPPATADEVAGARADAAGSLRLDRVTKRFGGATAVDAISLDIRAGEFLSLLGPSGCGKTTLLRMIAGFEQPSEGAILLDGTDITDTPAHRRPINTVFQSYALFPHMNVASNVAYGLKQSRVPRREINNRVREALEMVRMLDFAERKPVMLSGGQQQRIALARALVNRPQVLLLDEPMSALDRKLREEMQIELKLLQRRLGTTFVFVTHDQEEALTLSDRIAVMNGGTIQQIGGAEEIYARPANEFVAGFIGKQNFVPATVAAQDASGLHLDSALGPLLAAARHAQDAGPRQGGTGPHPASAVPYADRSRHQDAQAHTPHAEGHQPQTQTSPLAPGTRVKAAIRPEDINVVAAAPSSHDAAAATLGRAQTRSDGDVARSPGTNRLIGRVGAVFFLGDAVSHAVILPDGTEIIARSPRARAAQLSTGDAAECRFPAEAIQVFVS